MSKPKEDPVYRRFHRQRERLMTKQTLLNLLVVCLIIVTLILILATIFGAMNIVLTLIAIGFTVLLHRKKIRMWHRIPLARAHIMEMYEFLNDCEERREERVFWRKFALVILLGMSLFVLFVIGLSLYLKTHNGWFLVLSIVSFVLYWTLGDMLPEIFDD